MDRDVYAKLIAKLKSAESAMQDVKAEKISDNAYAIGKVVFVHYRNVVTFDGSDPLPILEDLPVPAEKTYCTGVANGGTTPYWFMGYVDTDGKLYIYCWDMSASQQTSGQKTVTINMHYIKADEVTP